MIHKSLPSKYSVNNQPVQCHCTVYNYKHKPSTQTNLTFYSLCFGLNLKLSVPVICGGTSRKRNSLRI